MLIRRSDLTNKEERYEAFSFQNIAPLPTVHHAVKTKLEKRMVRQYGESLLLLSSSH